MDLFDYKTQSQENIPKGPLAARMRPRTIDEVIGQEHIVGEGTLLRRAIEADRLTPMIFYGPPGTGKTTLAKVIANTTSANFEQLNAVIAGIKDVREVVQRAKDRQKYDQEKTVLFIDEIHRFNKGQQDALLPFVEDGTVILIGATTENPMFEVNPALLSRSRLFRLESLTNDAIKKVIESAITDTDRGFGNYPIHITDEAMGHLVNVSNGDARTALNALELAILTTDPNEDGTIYINLEIAEASIQNAFYNMTSQGINITTQFLPLLKVCVVQTQTPPCIG